MYKNEIGGLKSTWSSQEYGEEKEDKKWYKSSMMPGTKKDNPLHSFLVIFTASFPIEATAKKWTSLACENEKRD